MRHNNLTNSPVLIKTTLMTSLNERMLKIEKEIKTEKGLEKEIKENKEKIRLLIKVVSDLHRILTKEIGGVSLYEQAGIDLKKLLNQ